MIDFFFSDTSPIFRGVQFRLQMTFFFSQEVTFLTYLPIKKLCPLQEVKPVWDSNYSKLVQKNTSKKSSYMKRNNHSSGKSHQDHTWPFYWLFTNRKTERVIEKGGKKKLKFCCYDDKKFSASLSITSRSKQESILTLDKTVMTTISKLTF